MTLSYQQGYGSLIYSDKSMLISHLVGLAIILVVLSYVAHLFYTVYLDGVGML